MAASIEATLCTFIVEDLEWEGSADDLVGEKPVVLPEVLDSEELLEMITFVEDEYGIEIDDEEISADTLRTVADVARLIESKVAAA